MNIQNEIWKPIPGYEGYYEASDQGRIRSLDRIIITRRGSRRLKGKMLGKSADSAGYKQVDLFKPNRERIHKRVHSVIAETFLGPLPKDMEVCHNNGDKQDNRLANIRYDTPSNNNLDLVKHGTHWNVAKTHCPRGHLLQMPNLVAWKFHTRGHRTCLACHKAWKHIEGRKLPKSMIKELADENYLAIMQKEEPCAS